MTWGFTAQRRADEFDTLVEGRSTSADPASGAARDADLLELVGAMRAVPDVHARPEFVSDLRALLMAEAETALVPADTSRLRLPDRQPRRERRVAAIVGGIAIVGATTSVAVAAQSALPGETLYPIKRVLEGAHTGLSVGEGSKGTTVLANASDRLAEVDALARQDDAAADLRIPETLSTFTDQATQASDLLLSDYAHTGHESSIVALRDFAASSLEQLAALEPLVPVEARDELIRAARAVEAIGSEAVQQCPSCAGTPIDSIPPALAAPQIFLPVVPELTSGAGDPGPAEPGKPGKPGKDDGRPGDGLPSVDPADLDPGSVLNPTEGPSQSGGSGNPLEDLTDGLTGGLPNGTKSSGQPQIPVVSPVLQGVGELLESVVDTVVDPLLGGITKDPKK